MLPRQEQRQPIEKTTEAERREPDGGQGPMLGGPESVAASTGRPVTVKANVAGNPARQIITGPHSHKAGDPLCACHLCALYQVMINENPAAWPSGIEHIDTNEGPHTWHPERDPPKQRIPWSSPTSRKPMDQEKAKSPKTPAEPAPSLASWA